MKRLAKGLAASMTLVTLIIAGCGGNKPAPESVPNSQILSPSNTNTAEKKDAIRRMQDKFGEKKKGDGQ